MNAEGVRLTGIWPVDEFVEDVFSPAGEDHRPEDLDPFEDLRVLDSEPNGEGLDWGHDFSLFTCLSQMP